MAGVCFLPCPLGLPLPPKRVMDAPDWTAVGLQVIVIGQQEAEWMPQAFEMESVHLLLSLTASTEM